MGSCSFATAAPNLLDFVCSVLFPKHGQRVQLFFVLLEVGLIQSLEPNIHPSSLSTCLTRLISSLRGLTAGYRRSPWLVPLMRLRDVLSFGLKVPVALPDRGVRCPRSILRHQHNLV